MDLRAADDRWGMPLNPYPKIKVAAQRVLGVPDDVDAVATAVKQWRAIDLEESGADAGVVLPMPRTLEPRRYRSVLLPRGAARPERLVKPR